MTFLYRSENICVFQVNGRADIPVGVDQIFTFIGSKRGGDPGSEALRAAAFPESNMVLSRGPYSILEMQQLSKPQTPDLLHVSNQ